MPERNQTRFTPEREKGRFSFAHGQNELCWWQTSSGWIRVFLLTICPLFVSCATTHSSATGRHYPPEGTGPLRDYSQARLEPEKVEAAPDGTLPGYIAYSLRNSPKLAALFHRWQAAIQKIARARRLPDPVISYGYFVQSVETRVGPQRHKLSLKQSFPWPTLLTAGADAASAKARAMERRFDAQAVAIASLVEDRYWSIWALSNSKEIHREHLAVLTSLSESSRALLMTSKIILADQQQIDLAVARLEDLLQAIDEEIVQAKAGLRRLIGAPHDMPIEVVSEPKLQDLPNDESGLLSSVRNHPYLHSYRDLAEASEAEAERESAHRFPSFSLGVDWIETGRADTPNVKDSGKDAVMIGLGVSVPLWQSNYRETIGAYRSEAEAHKADGVAATDQAVAEFYTVLSKLRDAKRRVELFQGTLVPQAESVLESVIGAYTSGTRDIAAILLAQKDLLELRVQLVAIQASHAKLWAALNNLVGHPIAPPPPSAQPTGEMP